ncbi:hypothetical protein [Streptomyces sp. HB132]|uniref:hypothetical protein n=1 Tax=Streptomyces sp. HB132 TaxID=767388 RepID=UPI001E005D2C|nr:hypothetical protein [Streptomyces sp. HB132]MBM7439981.1 hypothetical protein [Streptomyces sp. HB132]
MGGGQLLAVLGEVALLEGQWPGALDEQQVGAGGQKRAGMFQAGEDAFTDVGERAQRVLLAGVDAEVVAAHVDERLSALAHRDRRDLRIGHQHQRVHGVSL